MVEVAEVRRAEGDELVELVLVQLQVLQAGPPDDAAQRVADEAYLEVLQLQGVYVVLDLDGQAVRGLFDFLLGLALIDRGQQAEDVAVFVPQIVADRLHVVGRRLVAVHQHYQLYLLALLQGADGSEVLPSEPQEGLVLLEGVEEEVAALVAPYLARLFDQQVLL